MRLSPAVAVARFGLAAIVLWLSQFPLYTIGHPPCAYNGQAFAEHLKAISNIAVTRIAFDLGVTLINTNWSQRLQAPLFALTLRSI
jgi:hypothetical protein